MNGLPCQYKYNCTGTEDCETSFLKMLDIERMTKRLNEDAEGEERNGVR